MGITSHDVARLAGVSQPSVSRALRDVPGVSAETRARVRDAARALGYVPSQAGRSLSTQSSGRIGVVSAELGNPFFPALIEPIHLTLGEHGYRTILVTDRHSDPVELETLIDGSLDGVILTTTEIDSTLPHELARRGLPFVMLNRTIEGVPADRCTADDFGGATLVADLFANLGHERIGAVFGPESTSTGRDGAAGFREGLAAHKIVIDSNLAKVGTFTTAAGFRSFTELMSNSDAPTAVFCANDVIAIGALNAASRMGLHVPEDVTIVGLDDIEVAGWPLVSLTTVHTNIDVIAREAAEMLVARIADPSAPLRAFQDEPTLVLRGTHGPPRRPSRPRRTAHPHERLSGARHEVPLAE